MIPLKHGNLSWIYIHFLDLDMLESKKVKEMAKSTTITRDEILADLKEQLKYATERIHNLNDLHEQQQTFFLGKIYCTTFSSIKFIGQLFL